MQIQNQLRRLGREGRGTLRGGEKAGRGGGTVVLRRRMQKDWRGGAGKREKTDMPGEEDKGE